MVVFPPDECCHKRWLKAVKDGLADATEWRCPKCGTLWRKVVGVVELWEHDPEIAIL
jgi:hypothetical protein